MNGDVLTYYDPASYLKMDQLVDYVFRWLENLIGEHIQYDPPNFIRDHSKIEDAYYYDRRKHSLAGSYPEQTKEWSEKNTDSSDTVMSYSNKLAIWKCHKCGREFTATVVNRTKNNSGCPYCAGRLPSKDNNVAVLYPDLLADWDENNDKSPYELLPNTKYLASWVCHKCGYRWKTMLRNRTRAYGSGCPECRKKKKRKA